MPEKPDHRAKIRSHLERARTAKPAPADPPSPIPRINELIKGARTSWFGLLSYLAFIGVTLLGVVDADFFITEHRTQLPLIGVTIPTAQFFYIAPVLGLMLYTYLHLYLLKLWEELASAPERVNQDFIGDEIDPWLVADYALTFRKDSPLRKRPLRFLANLVSLILIFVAAPFVLAAFWAWSMAKHDEILTVILCGVPLLFSIYVGATSFRRLRRLARKIPDGPIWHPLGWAVWVLFGLALSFLGWMRTEGTLADYARILRYDEAAISEATRLIPGQIPRGFLQSASGYDRAYRRLDYFVETSVRHRWWMQTDFLTAAQAASLDQFWLLLRLDPVHSPLTDEPVRHILAPARLSGEAFVATPANWQVRDVAEQLFRKDWCKTEGIPVEACGSGPFSDAEPDDYQPFQRQLWCDKTFDKAPVKTPADCLAHFAARDETYRLAWQTMRGVAIASLPHRDLTSADLRSANLGGARLEGANLFGARLEGANLRGATFDAATSLTEALFQAASVREVDFSVVSIFPEQVNSMFGDGSVTLPGGKGPNDREWPTHWPREILDDDAFETEWRAWQAAIGYTPPG